MLEVWNAWLRGLCVRVEIACPGFAIVRNVLVPTSSTELTPSDVITSKFQGQECEPAG